MRRLLAYREKYLQACGHLTYFAGNDRTIYRRGFPGQPGTRGLRRNPSRRPALQRTLTGFSENHEQSHGITGCDRRIGSVKKRETNRHGLLRPQLCVEVDGKRLASFMVENKFKKK